MSMTTARGGVELALTRSMIWSFATSALTKVSGTFGRTIRNPAMGSACACRTASAKTGGSPGIRPRTAMYGRLAWYRIASRESVTAIAIPVRAVVNTTPPRAVMASRKSVRFQAR